MCVKQPIDFESKCFSPFCWYERRRLKCNCEKNVALMPKALDKVFYFMGYRIMQQLEEVWEKTTAVNAVENYNEVTVKWKLQILKGVLKIRNDILDCSFENDNVLNCGSEVNDETRENVELEICWKAINTLGLD